MAIFFDLAHDDNRRRKQEGLGVPTFGGESDEILAFESKQVPSYRVHRDIDRLDRINQNRSEKAAMSSAMRNIQSMGPEGSLTRQGIFTGDLQPGETYLDDFADEIHLDSKVHKTGFFQEVLDVVQTPMYMVSGGVLELMRTGDMGEAFKQSLSELRYMFDDDYEAEYGTIFNRPTYRAEWGQILRANDGVIGRKLLDAGWVFDDNPWESMMKVGDLWNVITDKEYRESEARRYKGIGLTTAENHTLATLGVLADIAFDPLTYLGIGWIGKAGRVGLKGEKFLRGMETGREAAFRARKELNKRLRDPQQDVAIRRANYKEELEAKIGTREGPNNTPFIEENVEEALRKFDAEEQSAIEASLTPKKTRLGKVADAIPLFPSLRDEGISIPGAEGLGNSIDAGLSTLGSLRPARFLGEKFIQNNVVKRLQNPKTSEEFATFIRENAEEITKNMGEEVDAAELLSHLSKLDGSQVQNNAAEYLNFVNQASLDRASETQAIKNAMLYLTKSYGLDARYAMSLFAANTKIARKMIDEGPGSVGVKKKLHEVVDIAQSLTKEMTDKDEAHGLLDQINLRTDYLPSRAPLSSSGERTMRMFLEGRITDPDDVDRVMKRISESQGKQTYFTRIEGDVKATFQNQAVFKDLIHKLVANNPSEMDFALLYGNRSFESLRLRNTQKFQDQILKDRNLTIPIDMEVATNSSNALHKEFKAKGFDFYSPAGKWEGEGSVYYAMPKDMVRVLKTTNAMMEGATDWRNIDGLRNIVNLWQSGTTMWRQWALGSMAYVSRNIQSNMFTNYVAGVTNPKRYLESALLQFGSTENMPRALRSYVEFRVGGPKYIQDYKFKLKDGRVLSLKDMREEMDKNGIFSQTFTTNEMVELAAIESSTYGIYKEAKELPVGVVREAIQGIPSWGDTRERVDNAAKHIQDVFAEIKNENVSQEDALALAELYDGVARQYAWYNGGTPADWWNKLTIEGMTSWNQIKSKYVEQNIFDVLPQASMNDRGWQPWWDDKVEAMPALRSVMAQMVEEDAKLKKTIWRRDENGEQVLSFKELNDKIHDVVSGRKPQLAGIRKKKDIEARTEREKEWVKLRASDTDKAYPDRNRGGIQDQFMLFDDWTAFMSDRYPDTVIRKDDLVGALNRGLFRFSEVPLSRGQMLGKNEELYLNNRLDDGDVIFLHRIPQIDPVLSKEYKGTKPLSVKIDNRTKLKMRKETHSTPIAMRLNPSNVDDQKIAMAFGQELRVEDGIQDLYLSPSITQHIFRGLLENGRIDPKAFAPTVHGGSRGVLSEEEIGDIMDYAPLSSLNRDPSSITGELSSIMKERKPIPKRLAPNPSIIKRMQERGMPPFFQLKNSEIANLLDNSQVKEGISDVMDLHLRTEEGGIWQLEPFAILQPISDQAVGDWFRNTPTIGYTKRTAPINTGHNVYEPPGYMGWQLPITSRPPEIDPAGPSTRPDYDDYHSENWVGKDNVNYREGYVVAEGMPHTSAQWSGAKGDASYHIAPSRDAVDDWFHWENQHNLDPLVDGYQSAIDQQLGLGPINKHSDETHRRYKRKTRSRDLVGFEQKDSPPIVREFGYEHGIMTHARARSQAIAHYRTSDAYDSDGNKILVLHEIQSDLFGTHSRPPEEVTKLQSAKSRSEAISTTQKLLIREAAKKNYKKIIWAKHPEQVAIVERWTPGEELLDDTSGIINTYVNLKHRGGVGENFKKIVNRVDAKADDGSPLKITTYKDTQGGIPDNLRDYHALDISEDLSDKALNGGITFFQKHKMGAVDRVKGLTSFLDNGMAVITAFKSGDVSTMIHELAHFARRSALVENGDIDVINRWIFGMGEGGNKDIVQKRINEFSEEVFGDKRPLGRQFTEDEKRDFVQQIMWNDRNPLPGEDHNAEEKFALAVEKYILDGALKPAGLSNNHISALDRLTGTMRELYRENNMADLLPDELPEEVRRRLNSLLGQGVEPEPEKGKIFDEMVGYGELEERDRQGVGRQLKEFLFGLDGEEFKLGGVSEWREAIKSGEAIDGAVGQGILGKYAPPLSAEGLKRAMGNNAYLRFIRGFGRITEHNARGALFIQSMLDGMTGAEAAANVKKYLFDYSELTDFERDVMRNIIPFYTWIRKNLPLQLESIIDRPHKYANVGKILNEIGESSMYEYQDDPATPDYFRETLARRFPVNLGNQPTYITPDLPYLDVQLAEGLLDANVWIGMMHPALKTAIELHGNEKSLTGAPIWKEYGGDEPTMVGDIDLTSIYGPGTEHLINSLLPPASKLKSLFRADAKGATTTEIALGVLGAPLKTTDADAVLRHRRFELSRSSSRARREIEERIKKRAKLMGLNIGGE